MGGIYRKILITECGPTIIQWLTDGETLFKSTDLYPD